MLNSVLSQQKKRDLISP